MTKEPLIIELKDILKEYKMGDQKTIALDNISFSISSGEMVALIGSSGSGKSTATQIIGLLDRPTSGEYKLSGQEVSKLSRDERATTRNQKIGFVFQSFFLLPKLLAWENVGLPLMYRDIPVSEIKQRALEELERVGLSDRAYHTPNQLSGGQQQRVAIARALVTNPEILLADEPTGALDSKTGDLIMQLLLDCNKQGYTMIIVTHDLEIAKQCQRVIQLSDGHIIEKAI